MQPSVVLILYLATLYVLTMVIFLHCLRGRKTDVFMMTAPRTDVPLVLQQGQTIIPTTPLNAASREGALSCARDTVGL